jgi:hypothetical protein
VDDTRIIQTRSLIQDAQQVLSGLAEEIVGNDNLEAARFSLLITLRHLKILEGS